MSKLNAQTKPVTTEAPKTVNKEVRVIPDVIKTLPTKSAKIRALASEGWTKGETAKAMGIIYQHVYNVLAQPLPKPKAEVATKVESTKTTKVKSTKKK